MCFLFVFVWCLYSSFLNMYLVAKLWPTYSIYRYPPSLCNSYLKVRESLDCCYGIPAKALYGSIVIVLTDLLQPTRLVQYRDRWCSRSNQCCVKRKPTNTFTRSNNAAADSLLTSYLFISSTAVDLYGRIMRLVSRFVCVQHSMFMDGSGFFASGHYVSHNCKLVGRSVKSIMHKFSHWLVWQSFCKYKRQLALYVAQLTYITCP